MLWNDHLYFSDASLRSVACWYDWADGLLKKAKWKDWFSTFSRQKNCYCLGALALTLKYSNTSYFFFLFTYIYFIIQSIIFSLVRDFGVRWWLCWVGQGSYHRQWILPRWLFFKNKSNSCLRSIWELLSIGQWHCSRRRLIKAWGKIVITSVCGQIVFMPAHWVCLDNRKL